jgi:futalosine hydrolase
MILVVCALPAELRYFSPRPNVEVVACGVGPVEAAIAVATALVRAPYDAVVNAGIAGAFRGSARVGDAVLVGDETLADFGLEGGAALSLPDGATLADRARADAGLLARCRDNTVLQQLVRGLTVAQVTATDATAARLQARFGADVESMEGFSVLRAAAVAGVASLEVRGISNYVGARDAAQWDFALGARAAARALDAVLDCIA